MKGAIAIEKNRLAATQKQMAALRALREAKGEPNPKPASKPWIDDVREMIVKNGKRVFCFGDIDSVELGRRHLKCNTVEAMIRHVLQVMRDNGEVAFVDDHGTYIYLPLEWSDPA